MNDAVIRRRLWLVLLAYESLVIAVVAGAGLNIALMGGGSLAMAAPLALIACAEALRIPLSAMATRLRWAGQLLAAIALLAIAIGSAEGLAVAFEAFLQNRVVEIMRASRDVERAQRVADQVVSDRAHDDATVAGLANEVAQLDTQAVALARSMPTLPAASNRTCSWKGQRVACSSDVAAVAAYREAMRAYDERLGSLTAARASLQAKVDAARASEPPAASPEASEALLEAKQAFEEKASQSPVWRLTAAVFGESVSAVTPEQFARVKTFATATLAIAFATLSMAVSVVVHAKRRSEAPGKLVLALRRMIAARRKTLRRIEARVEYRDRVVVKHIPFDPKSGFRIKPDGEPGEVISPIWKQQS